MDFPSRFKDNAENSTGLLFIRAYNKWHTKQKNELLALGITHPQFVVMTTLSFLRQSDEFVTQAKIAKMADIDVMTVSQIVRGLETKGILKRFPNPNDTRANAVELLPEGEEIFKQAFPLVIKIDDEFFGSLGEKEDVLRGLLSQIL